MRQTICKEFTRHYTEVETGEHNKRKEQLSINRSPNGIFNYERKARDTYLSKDVCRRSTLRFNSGLRSGKMDDSLRTSVIHGRRWRMLPNARQ
ncbi:hypothetical protein SAMN04488156_10361 [Bacillus sp. 166amftsu]|nr:hypothetical protein SAMN04488156_10361 [Bacillus sp. 166amftsu]